MPLTARGKIDRKALPPVPKFVKEQRTTARAPANDIERALCAIWRDVLKSDAVSVDDNFYDLGGTSLQAFQIFARMAEEFDRDLPPTAMLDAPTIERQAILLRDASADRVSRKVLTFRAGGKRSPLFFLHDGYGAIMFARELVRDLKSDRPVYGLQPPPLDGAHRVLRTVEDIAADYLAEIRKVQPSGPYCLAGYSFGGFVALEIAQQLTRGGEPVSFVGIIDTGFELRHAVAGEVLSSRIRRHMGQFWRGSALLYFGTRLKKTVWDRLQTMHGELLKLPKELRLVLGYAIPFDDRPLFYCRVFHRSSRRYSPKPYEGAITMFARTEVAGLHRARWLTLARGGLMMHEIPARHAEIVWPPHSTKLAEYLDSSLDTIA
jgi:acetoacetyl-CoA synthetase